MKKRLLTSLLLTTLISAPATAADALHQKATEIFSPIPTTPPQLKNNTITYEKIDLGKKLFMDPRLSVSGLISCHTCHNLTMGGDDNLETSIGHGWAKGPRNAPTVLNAVYNVAQFWDGRAEDLKAQAKGPIQAGVEMAATPEHVETTLNSMPEYVAQFGRAFPGEENPVSFDNMAKAIEAFEAILITPAARFDQYLEGNLNIINEQEKAGLALFIDKGCSNCHGGMNIGGTGYYPFGVVEKPGADVLPEDDKGRYSVTQTASDQYVFRAPPLRNIDLTAPYFHSGTVWNLEQAVAIMGSAQLGIELKDSEIKSIVAFLKTLTGEQPRITLPILPVSTATTPQPVAMIPEQSGH